MHSLLRCALLLALAAAAAGACAATGCPQFYAAGQPPEIAASRLQPRTREICFGAFAVMHSGVSRTPLWAAERLERRRLRAARKVERRDAFHAEQSLPPADRAELADYARSGYDRGHMAPSADMPSRRAQAQSFSLANMVPQAPQNNQGIWAGMEMAVRGLAESRGEAYVLSGPAFLGDRVGRIGNVLVPTHLWKVVYLPRTGEAGAYFIPNQATTEYSALSVAQLEKIVGLRLLPGLPQKVRETAMRLPDPVADERWAGAGRPSGAPAGGYTPTYRIAEVLKAMEKLLKRFDH
ncbi:MAG: DNA/RNA non-specific endonuclease [Xylophilus ampelinus]